MTSFLTRDPASKTLNCTSVRVFGSYLCFKRFGPDEEEELLERKSAD